MQEADRIKRLVASSIADGSPTPVQSDPQEAGRRRERESLLCYLRIKWDPGVLPLPVISQGLPHIKIPDRRLCSLETVSRALLG